jgi:hypothetical protein
MYWSLVDYLKKNACHAERSAAESKHLYRTVERVWRKGLSCCGGAQHDDRV